MSPTTGTRSRITSSPIGRLMPGMTNIRSSSFSIVSTRWRTDCGSVPNCAKGRRSSLGVAISVSAWLLLQVGERVTGVTVPGKALDASRNQRPAHRSCDRDEQLRIVDPRRGLRQQGIALRWDERGPRSIHELTGLDIADRHQIAAEAAHE